MPSERSVTLGLVVCRLKNIETGEVWVDEYPNLITDVGDYYFASKMISAVPPASPALPNLINGVKLGTGTATPTKNGAAAALGAYITSSNNGLDALSTPGYGGGPYPKIDNSLGPGNGVRSVYVVSYVAGDVINSAISEAVLVVDAGTDGASIAANTISRALIGPYNKTSSLELDIVWQQLHLGA